MQQEHEWMAEVLSDLEIYAVENSLDRLGDCLRECGDILQADAPAAPEEADNVYRLFPKRSSL